MSVLFSELGLSCFVKLGFDAYFPNYCPLIDCCLLIYLGLNFCVLFLFLIPVRFHTGFRYKPDWLVIVIFSDILSCSCFVDLVSIFLLDFFAFP
jgi:hypothetical protein